MMKLLYTPPLVLASGGSPIVPLVFTIQLFLPSSQQFRQSGELVPQIQGLQLGTSVDAFEEMMCVGSKRQSIQAVELSQQSQTAVQIVPNLPTPSNGGPIYRFWQAGHVDPLDG